MKVTGVSASFVPHVWARVEPLLRPAVEPAAVVVSLDDVLRDLCIGRQVLWIVYDGETIVGALVTELCDRPKARVCSVNFMGGHGLDDWYDTAADAIGTWAKANGCTVYEALVRRGLVRRLRHSFQEVGTVIRRMI